MNNFDPTYGDVLPSPQEGYLDAGNPEERTPCVLLLDTSGSMNRGKLVAPIDELNEGIVAFKEAVLEDKVARNRVEVAIVTFGGEHAELVQNFTEVEYFTPPVLDAQGATPMGEAILIGLNLIEERKREYKSKSISYKRPWMFIITDGEPTDEGWEHAVGEMYRAIDAKKLTLFVIGVESANMEKLQLEIAHPERGPMKLNESKNSFNELFVWLSASLSVASKEPGTGKQIALPAPTGWASATV
jgi:uncharacterized protein YegL